VQSSTTLSAELIVDAKPLTSCDYHRVVLPFSVLKKVKPKVPVLVFNRLYSGGYAELCRMKKNGARVIVDIDDSPFLDSSHYLFEHYKRDQTSTRIVNELALADVITVTNSRLADVVRGVLPKASIEVVPNALPFDKGQFIKNRLFDDPQRVVYAAGPSHYLDSKILPLGFGQDYAFAGDMPHPQWQKMREHHPHASFRLARPVQAYMGLYEGHKIAVAPLKRSDFNACKSNLKMLEAGARGLAFVASPVHPYTDSIDIPHVVYADTKTDWGDAFRKLFVDRSYREDMAASLAQHVRENYQLERSNKIRRQIIESFR